MQAPPRLRPPLTGQSPAPPAPHSPPRSPPGPPDAPWAQSQRLGGVVPLPGRPQVGRRGGHLNQSAGACPARTDFWPGHGHTHTLRHSQVLTHQSHSQPHTASHSHAHTYSHTHTHSLTHTHTCHTTRTHTPRTHARTLTHASQPHTCTHTSQPDTHSHMPHTTRTHTPHALTRIHSHTHTPSVAEFGPCVASFSRPRSSSQVTRGWCGKSGL